MGDLLFCAVKRQLFLGDHAGSPLRMPILKCGFRRAPTLLCSLFCAVKRQSFLGDHAGSPLRMPILKCGFRRAPALLCSLSRHNFNLLADVNKVTVQAIFLFKLFNGCTVPFCNVPQGIPLLYKIKDDT